MKLKDGILKTVLLVTVLGLAACDGKKQNPLDDYRELREEAVPPHEQQLRTQNYVGSEVIQINPEKDINFVEGTTSEFKIKARVLQEGVTFDLVASDLPDGASLTKDVADPSVWILSWQPPLGFTQNNEIEKEVYYSLGVNVKSYGGDRNEQLLKLVNKNFDFSFKVRKTYEPPKVMAISGLPESLSEGEVAQFTVDVQVPGSYEGNLPRLDVYYDGTGNSKEKYEGNGAVLVRRSTSKQLPEKISEETWRFFYEFDLKNNVFVDRSQSSDPFAAGTTAVKINFKVYGPTGVSSPEMKHVLNVNYNAMAKPQCSTGAE